MNIKPYKRKVDFVISCGAACRPAHYTQSLKLRKFSSPCDWMYNYSLVNFIEVLQTDAQHMFLTPCVNKEKKHVRDTRNGMISMHDFNLDAPLENQLPDFYHKMHKRAVNTNFQISNSKEVGILMNRQIHQNELFDFCKVLSSMYPNCSFHILNIFDIPEQKTIAIDFLRKYQKSTILQISFNDGHKNGREAEINPEFWLGNEPIWNSILPKIFQVKGARRARLLQRCTDLIARGRSLCKRFIKKIARMIIPK